MSGTVAIKRKGVLAVPGEYRYGDRVEIKTAEELKKVANMLPIIPLTLGHPKNPGLIFESDFIGTVHPKWDEEKQALVGEFWFYEEKIPEEIKQKIVNEEPLPISAGFTVETVENGVQKGILFHHVAVLQNENPVCPLDTCGVNIRLESSSQQEEVKTMYYEQKSELGEKQQEKPAEEQQKQEQPAAITAEINTLKSEIGELKQLLSQLAEKISGPVAKDSKDEQPVKTAEEKPQKEQPSATAQEEAAPVAEPEVAIPRPAKESKGSTTWEDGAVATGKLILGAKEP